MSLKRGTYRTPATFDARSRVVASVMEGGDWKSVALANGIKIGTAYNWVRKMEQTLKVRGARKGMAPNSKLSDQHVDCVLKAIEDNGQ